MISFLQHLFDTSGFPARWHCGQWSAGHGWLHILSDIAIFGAYSAIPLTLAFFIRRRKDVPFLPIFWLFAAFIVACGLSHLIEATIFWHPWYRLSGLLKLVTAVVSWLTVFALLKVLPSALALPGIAKINEQLSAEIAERKQAAEALRKSEEFNRTVLQSSPDCVKVIDRDGVVISLNEPGRCLLELDDPAEALGKKWWELWPEEARTKVRGAFERARAGEVARFEQFCPTARGTPKWWDVQVSPVHDGDGAVERVVAVSRDVTERRQNEEASREQKHFLDRITAVTPDVLYVLDIADYHFKWVSPQAANRLGYSAEEILAMGADFMPRVMHPDDLARMPAHFAELARAADGQTLEIDYRLRHSDDSWRWFGGRKTPFTRDADGRVREIMGTSADITSRKHSEQRDALQLGVTQLLASAGAEGTLLPALLKVIGEGLGWDFGAIWLVDEAAGVVRCEEIWHREIAGIAPFAAASRAATFARGVGLPGRVWADPAHEVAWVRDVVADENFPRAPLAVAAELHAACAFPILVGGECIGVVEFYCRAIPQRDDALLALLASFGTQVGQVVERRQAEAEVRASEARLKLGMQVAGMALAEIDYATGLNHLSADAARIFGLGDAAIAVPRATVHATFHPEDRAQMEPLIAACLDPQGDGAFATNHRVVWPGGEVRWLRVRKQVFFEKVDGARRPARAILAALDITEQKRAEHAASEEAKRKDEFLAMLGHELRNPLNAIRHAVQISGETPDDAEACQWAAHVIDRQSQQLSRMVDDLLDVARINRGRIDLRVESLDLGAVLEGAVSVVRVNAEKRQHTLAVEIGEGLRVTGDAARLEQVFVNLLNNAIKYTPEGGHVGVHARHEDGEVIVTITDSGVGIPAELLPHVFDLFRQAESTLDRAQGGLGIGLSVVKSLVEMHLGRVTVESAGAGTGTTVTVRLPLLLEMRHTLAAPAAPAARDTSERRIRVLVVDDHEDAAQALARLLTRRGCEVRCAHTGPDGVTAARDFLPEVLLLDLGLPGFDGYELARTLRAEAPFTDALFIAISGYAQEGDRTRCLAAGFNEHFAKPIDFAKLMEAIRSGCMARW